MDRGVKPSAGARTWLITFATFTALTFLPLALGGIFGDFLHSLRGVAFGSTYNKVTFDSFATGWLLPFRESAIRWLVVPPAILLLSHGTAHARTARALLMALAGATLYKPLSPTAHFYLDLPLVLAWSVNLASLAGLIVSKSEAPSTIKLVGMLILLGMAITTLSPESCAVGPSPRAVATLRSGVEPDDPPPGYRHGPVPMSAFYPWGDYRAALVYLRAHTGPTTKVANALKGDPAIVSEVDRPSAFPAESITWLKMVDREDEPAFVESLERATDSVALWTPGAFPPRLDSRSPGSKPRSAVTTGSKPDSGSSRSGDAGRDRGRAECLGASAGRSFEEQSAHSHSIVPGGLLVTS